MSYETHIILVPVDKMSDGRKAVERIQDQKFDNKEAVENAICFNEHDPMAVEDLGVMNMDAFMDACNNSDDDSREQEWSDIIDNLDNYWIGYIKMKV